MHGWSLEGKVVTGAPHLFGAPPKAENVHQASYISADRTIEDKKRQQAHFQLSKLSTRTQLEDGAGRSSAAFWKDKLQPGLPEEANPMLPSGYTYLLQLVAHDLTDTGPAALVAGASNPNARSRPLLLDTIYGAGPDSNPYIYSASDKVRDSSSFPDLERAPRRYLRTGRRPEEKLEEAAYCPFRDIARGSQSSGAGMSNCDPMLADARNDSHAIMSQMTVLWHTLHNLLIGQIKEEIGGAPKIEMAYRRFALARTIMTLIYRRIVRDDLLARILHPEIAAFYGKSNGWSTKLLSEFQGIPLEFSRGAFRFGHAMVKNNYAINSMVAVNHHPEGLFLSLTSARKPDEMPLKADWMIDWAFFFDMNSPGNPDPRLNYSNRIGPRYANAIHLSLEFNAKSEFDNRGLLHRDLKSALYSGMWKVPDLLGVTKDRLETRSPETGSLFADWPRARARLVTWLQEHKSNDQFELTKAEAEAIADDPPLPFYVVFEAAMNPQSEQPDTKGMGEHLGPLGSLIVAETFLGALNSVSVVEDEQKLSLAECINAACRAIMGANAPEIMPNLSSLSSPPQTMAELLRFMKEAGAFDT